MRTLLSLAVLSLAGVTYMTGGGATLAKSALLVWVAYEATRRSTPRLMRQLRAAGITGRDLNKGSKGKELPEALGLAAGYIVLMLAVAALPFVAARRTEYYAAVLAASMTLTIGLADDILELKFRTKLVLPFLAALPLLVSHHTEGAPTTVRGASGLTLR